MSSLCSPFENIVLQFYPVYFFPCSYALVVVEMKNQGDDAFKSEIYGDVIIIERRITESSSTTVLKNYQGLTSAHFLYALRHGFLL